MDSETDGAPTYADAARVEEFFLADREVGALAGSASLAATQMSAGTFVGTIGIHYAVGVSFLAIWPGIWLGWLCSLFFVAPKLRRFGGMTIPDYVAARYDGDGADGDRTRALVGALVALVYLVYTAAQYVAGGVLVSTLFGVPRLWGMVGITALVLAYTASGGMRASIASDAVQMALMLAGVLVAAAVGVAEVGGFGALYGEAVAIDPTLFGFGMSPTRIAGFAAAFGLGMAVAPYEMSRVYAMRDDDTVRTAIKGSIAMQAVVAVCVALLGLIARVRFPELASPDAAVVELALTMLGPVGGGLLVVAVVAAILSTTDSILLVSASALAHDLYAGVLRDRLVAWGRVSVLDDATGDVMAVTRLSTVAAAVVPLALAARPGLLGGLVQIIVALYATLVAGTLFAPVVLGLNWAGATTAGGVAGVLVGFGSVVGWHLATTVTGSVAAPLGTVPTVFVGVAASALAVVAVSLVDRQRGGGAAT